MSQPGGGFAQEYALWVNCLSWPTQARMTYVLQAVDSVVPLARLLLFAKNNREILHCLAWRKMSAANIVVLLARLLVVYCPREVSYGLTCFDDASWRVGCVPYSTRTTCFLPPARSVLSCQRLGILLHCPPASLTRQVNNYCFQENVIASRHHRERTSYCTGCRSHRDRERVQPSRIRHQVPTAA